MLKDTDDKDLILVFIDIQDGVGQGGPIEGFDISVYHVETDFKLGMIVDDVDGDGIDDSSKEYIWPACLPKSNSDPEFNVPNRIPRGMIAGWLDAPPPQQIRSNLLGNLVSGEDVLRSIFISRVIGLEMLDKCEDPDYQRENGVNTFYPQGTVCSVDPSFGKQKITRFTIDIVKPKNEFRKRMDFN